MKTPHRKQVPVTSSKDIWIGVVFRNSTGIKPGDEYPEYLRDAIQNSKVIIVMIEKVGSCSWSLYELLLRLTNNRSVRESQ